MSTQSWQHCKPGPPACHGCSHSSSDLHFSRGKFKHEPHRTKPLKVHPTFTFHATPFQRNWATSLSLIRACFENTFFNCTMATVQWSEMNPHPNTRKWLWNPTPRYSLARKPTYIKGLLIWVSLEVVPVLPMVDLYPPVWLVKEGEGQHCLDLLGQGHTSVGTHIHIVELPCMFGEGGRGESLGLARVRAKAKD